MNLKTAHFFHFDHDRAAFIEIIRTQCGLHSLRLVWWGFFRYDHVLTTFFEHVQSSTTSSASMETISRPYRFLLRSYNVVQSSCCVHPIFVGRSGNVAGVTEVYILCHSMAAIAKGLENIIMFAKISKYRKYQKYDIFWYFLYFW